MARNVDVIGFTTTKAINKCFVLAEYHYSLEKGTSSWATLMSLWDVYENVKFGDFGENHYVHYKPDVETSDELITCETGRYEVFQCGAVQQFRASV